MVIEISIPDDASQRIKDHILASLHRMAHAYNAELKYERLHENNPSPQSLSTGGKKKKGKTIQPS
ncbi:MAG: hypothetical protein HXX08_11250 [Chloroflexi bacterium]|uniref:Uncharacterized protein n=1 Tax=Candidatus Chlorohelix allophototropha TaxID=3003348 RepID=A0A8T7M3N1_9CHLR|nr:hypothetical protein [Chloroflexota bacterium]WJW65813.1 hypothetical protein OZ401_001592 [Chloroflexota bacterium L227-S17]